MRTKLRGKVTLLFIVCAALLSVPAIALADVVQNDVDSNIDATVESKTIVTDGSTQVGYTLRPAQGQLAPTFPDTQNGCNGTTTDPVTIDINTPTGVTASASSLSFSTCDVTQFVTFSATKVGTHNITVTVTDQGRGGTTYPGPAAWDLIVNKAQTGISAVSGTGNAGASNGSLTATLKNTAVTPNKNLEGKDITFEIDGSPVSGVASTNSSGVATLTGVDLSSVSQGTKTLTAKFAGDDDYLLSSGSGNLVVGAPLCTPVSVTSDPADESITYGDDAEFTATANGNPTPTVQWQVDDGTGWTNLDGETNTTLSLTKPPVADSGNQYRAVFSNTCGTNGSTATSAAATLTVAQRAITVTADAQSKTYGNADPALTYQLDNSTPLAPNETLSGILSGSLTRASGETVANSPYAIQQGTLVANGNYNMTFVGANLTIDPRPITVVPNANQSKIYGNTDPTLTYSLASGSTYGFSDTASTVFTGNLTRASGENAGNYAIQQGTLAANSNYSLTFSSTVVNFTIDPRPITVTADNKTKILGAATDPALTYSLTNGTLGFTDTLSGVLSGSLTRDSGESIGSYPIRQGTLAANSNYSLSFVNGTLKIVYNVSVTSGAGFQQPINNTAHFLTTYGSTFETNSVFKAGSTVPVKFVLKDAQGNIVQSNTAPKWVTPKQGSAFSSLNVNEETTFLTSTTDGTFDWDGTQYQYNWSTKNFAPNYFWRIGISLDDGTFHYVSIGLRK